uniref:cGMP-dependent protein kinase egl-4 n=1 Tax=Globodera rostochiensis TaxID=31243 RepID=A0A914ICV8_GLORO
MAEVAPEQRRWTLRLGGLVEAVNGAHIDPSGRTDLLKVLDRAKRDGTFPLDDGEMALLECDCDVLRVSEAPEGNNLLALIPLHQLSSVGFVREAPQNILALKVGDVEEGKPDLFDLIILFTPTEEIADEICQHLAVCFQFVYREALSTLEEDEADRDTKDCPQGDISAKFVPAAPSSATSSSLCSLPPSPFPSPSNHNNQPASHQRLLASVDNANSTSTSSNSTKQVVELINEYLTMLSACLSHDELNKFAILMRRWRAREMPILEFAQKLLELYGPERRHLLARMRTLLRGDPSELEALTDFLRANGVVENAAAMAASPLLTAEMSLGEEVNSSKSTASSLPSAPLLRSPNRLTKLAAKRLHNSLEDEVAAVKIGKLAVSTAQEQNESMSSSSQLHVQNSGQSHSAGRQKEGGTGFRRFFDKLRKPSEIIVQIGSRTYDAQELQKLVPRMEGELEKQDRLLRQNQKELDAHQKRIGELEVEVKTLSSECDKLRSVLNQKAESAATLGGQKRSDDLHTEMKQAALLPEVGQVVPEVRAKKMAVSAEPTKLDQHKATLQHHSKSAGCKQLIRDAVQKNDFLRQLAKEQIIELVECMFEMRARAGQWVIQEGEPGDRLYVIAEGQLQVSREGQSLGVMNPGVAMGELAILYNCERTASIQAITDCVLFCLDRSVFQMITMRLGMERHAQLMNFLHKVEIFVGLPEDRLSKMADVMDQDYYAADHYIIREGEKGDTFFVINSGQVRVTQSIEGELEPREVRVLKQGEFFGEKALLGEEVRTANVIALAPGVEVLTLDRESFLKLIGDLEPLLKQQRAYRDEDIKRRSARTEKDARVSPIKTEIPELEDEFAQIQLRQLKRIATLGVGGFGRVELVCINADKSRSFALKALKKKHVVDTRQQEHIFAERNIMLETRTDWIVRLYKTFRDSKYVYMLLEACLGGELWTTLRDRGHFDDYTARFYVACVLEGLEHLHRRNIVYRDLKPENCLLTTSGYLKLVDFGFAKKLASGRKTWTFCGTPEYVSPEIILNKGHDQAADYWALGIYICELMLGRPPFQASDPMKTYTLILKGIDVLEIPNRRIGKTATALVKKLCRDNPGERLGSGSGGVNDIRKHRWFMGFDWDGLRSRTLKPPIIPKVSNPADVSNFDNYPPDQDIPPDEFSGWDEGF